MLCVCLSVCESAASPAAALPSAVMGCDVMCNAVGYFCSVEIFGSEQRF